jgi:hypothetical protein
MGTVTDGRSRLIIPRDLIDDVETFEQFRRMVLRKIERRRFQIVIDPTPLVAYVNYGRWCADCPFCFAGVALDPEWDQTFCLGCFRSFPSILWPGDVPGIEAALVVRWLKRQHWNTLGGMTRNALIAAETVADLLAENDQSTDPPPPPILQQPEAVWLGLLR